MWLDQLHNTIDSLSSRASLTEALGWLAGVSLATFLLSLLLIPLVVAKLPRDCFLRLQVHHRRRRQGIGFLVLLLLRNFLGMMLLLAGIAMLFLPGQGLLTMILGLLLLSFPGKDRLILWLTASPSSRRSLDWLRSKSGKEPFLWPYNEPAPQGNGAKGR